MASLLHSESRRLYSWWWDSHISPKNSKWLQENLADMDSKVKQMIKLIEEDADSFARRAEMYYKKRPELMKLVEEFYRAYRALAERYDHATGELRHAHRTMVAAFPNQVSLELAEDSLSGSILETEPHTPEVVHPIRALLDLEELQKDELGLSTPDLYFVKKNGPYYRESTAGIDKKGLKQLHGMHGVAGILPLDSRSAEEKVIDGENLPPEGKEQNLNQDDTRVVISNHSLKDEGQFESEHADKTDGEVQKLKKDLVDMQAAKEAALLQYQKCLEKLSNLEGEFSLAQKDCMRFSDEAINAATEVHQLKEALVKLEAERDTGLIKHKECLKRISDLEAEVSHAQEVAKGINGRAIRTEFEAQCLKNELSRLESEKEFGLQQYNLSLDKISNLKNELSVTEKNVRLLNEQADRAEAEIKKLEKSVAELNEEKEATAVLYKSCLERVSQLESEISCAQADLKRLNAEVLLGASKLKGAEEKCAVLEISNKSLLLEAENLAKKIVMKDQQLYERQAELDKLQTCVKDERTHYVQIETALKTLQNLHSQSQEEQQALAMEFRNGLELLKTFDMCKHGLEEEIQRVEAENQNLKDLNLSSTTSMENLQNEIISLREMKERLEAGVFVQIGQNDALLQEICHLKQEIKSLNQRYQALMEQLASVGLNPECISLSVKGLQGENSNLRQIYESERDEKASLSKKLEQMERLLEKSAVLETSLSEVNCQLAVSRKKVKELQESCQSLHGEKFALVAEKAVLLSQLQIITESMHKLLQKQGALENSLSAANSELEGLREKSKYLEEICQLLKNDKSNLLLERSSLVVQLQNAELRFGNLENRFTGLEGKYAELEKEKKSAESQVEALRVSLGVEKQERASCKRLSETRLTSMENQIHFLQEQNRWGKKELEEELDKAVNAQFDLFILQKFLQDMEEKNYLLLLQIHKHVEASKWTENLISELENENLEQHVEAEILLDKIQKLRSGVYQVFRALEIGGDREFADKIENNEVIVESILGNIEDMKCSESNYKDNEQQLLVENSVLLSILEQLVLDSIESKSEKKILDQELKMITEQLVMTQKEKNEILKINRQLRSEVAEVKQQANILEAEVNIICTKHCDLERSCLELEKEYALVLEQNRSLLKQLAKLKEDKCFVEEENDAILLEILSFGYLSVIFKSIGAEKAAELELLSENLHNLHVSKDNLENKVSVLQGELGMTQKENLLLIELVGQLETDLYGVKEFNDRLTKEISSGNDSLSQRENELSEIAEKLNAVENLNSELCRTMEGLKKEIKESDAMKEDLENKVVKLLEHNTSHDKEIECLLKLNGSLISEVSALREEIEEQRIREENLCFELQQKTNEFELWDAEASTFYFDLQISSIREVLFKNKVAELTEVSETLEGESASKTEEIEKMKDQVSFMENETAGLKAQLFAYIPVIASLRENVESLEHNILPRTKFGTFEIEEPKDVETEDRHCEKICQELIADQKFLIPNGIKDLHELQNRIKAVEKVVVGKINRSMSRKSFKTNMQVETAMREILELNSKCRTGGAEKGKRKKKEVSLQNTEPKTYEMKNGSLMKDIPLDQVSDGKFCEIRRGNFVVSHGADNQSFKLWETSGQDCNIDQTMNDWQMKAHNPKEDDVLYYLSEDVEKSEDFSSELNVEKELGVDRLEISTNVRDSRRAGSTAKILERLASDANKLASLQLTVQGLRKKVETNKKIKKAKDVDVETVKEQLHEVDETVVQLTDLNGQLANNIEKTLSCSNRRSSPELEAIMRARRKRASEQARRGSEKIGRLQVEVQKIQYLLLKYEDDKRSDRKNRLLRNRTTIILRDFIYSGSSSSRRKKSHCGCFRPNIQEDRNNL